MTSTQEPAPAGHEELIAANAEAPPSAHVVQAKAWQPPQANAVGPAPSPERELGCQTLLADIKRQVELQPAQLRKLQRRLEEVGLGLGEARFKTLLERLISYADLIERAQRELRQSAEGEGIGGRLLGTLHGELLHILELNDVRPCQDREDELFEPQKHACVETVSAPSPDKDGHVARIESPGYTFGERRLRHSSVSVYKYNAESAHVGREESES